MYADYLRAAGFEVREVGTTDEAILLASGTDLVITGLMVSGTVDPLDFIRRTRSEHSDTPIVVVTACAYSDFLAKAYEAGARVVLVKPCFPDVLLKEIQSVIDSPQVRLVSPPPRRVGDDRRFDERGGRRDGDRFHTAS